MFGIFGGFKVLKWVLVISFFAVLGFLGWQYHSSMNGRITGLINQNQALVQNNATLEGNNTALKDGIETANETVTHLQETYAKFQKDYQELSDQFVVIRLQNDELKEKLGRHDLETLAAAKPKLVESIINKATIDAFRCFEVMTGSPKKPNETNKECPWEF